MKLAQAAAVEAARREMNSRILALAAQGALERASLRYADLMSGLSQGRRLRGMLPGEAIEQAVFDVVKARDWVEGSARVLQATFPKSAAAEFARRTAAAAMARGEAILARAAASRVGQLVAKAVGNTVLRTAASTVAEAASIAGNVIVPFELTNSAMEVAVAAGNAGMSDFERWRYGSLEQVPLLDAFKEQLTNWRDRPLDTFLGRTPPTWYRRVGGHEQSSREIENVLASTANLGAYFNALSKNNVAIKPTEGIVVRYGPLRSAFDQ